MLYRQDGRVQVIRQAHESLLNECVPHRVEADRGGKSEPLVLDGNRDQYQYIRILE